MKAKNATAVVFLVAVSLFVSCNSKQETTSTQRTSTGPDVNGIYTNGPRATMRLATLSLADQGGVVLKARIAEFLRQNPNATLNIEEYPGNDIIPAINTAIMANNCPDVFLFFRPEAGWNVPAYAEAGALADLTALIHSPAFEGVFPEFALKTASQINGVYYCIPRVSYYDEFLVNKVIFDKFGIPLPDTWDKLMAAVPALKKNGIIPWQITTAPLLDSASRLLFNILNRMVGNERALGLFAGTEHWTDRDVFTGLQYFVTLAAGNGPPDSNVLNQAQSIAKYLSTGNAGMLLENNGGNTNVDPAVLNDLVAIEFPKIPGGFEIDSSTEKDE
jgi:raffinose/stachyose/melibiose transport system substrate-binding protein